MSSRAPLTIENNDNQMVFQAVHQANDDKRRQQHQQQRREELLLSLSGKSDIWYEMIANGHNKTPRMKPTKFDQNNVMRPYMSLSTQESQPKKCENIYACLDEDPIIYRELYLGHDDLWACRSLHNQRNPEALRARESQLFADQLSHLTMIADGREVEVDCNLTNYESIDHRSRSRCTREPNKQTKRSFFSKMMQLLTPTTSSNKHENNHHSNPRMDSNEQSKISRPDITSQHKSGSTYNKSRTLRSKSTQNLLNSSMRFLSSSRKSINLSTSRGSDTKDEDGFFSSRSFISGFLTIGRRSGVATAADLFPNKKGHKFSNKKNYDVLGQIFKENQQHNTLRRIYSSVDSLPSADSGLSCSNLPSNSCEENNCPFQKRTARPKVDCNIYSQVPNYFETNQNNNVYYESLIGTNCEKKCVSTENINIIGRAKAKVDCNPCAYDKEALVFKKGDIIDILERHQSGTWIGRCADRIGHFKFINVVELTDEAQDEEHGSTNDVKDARDTCKESRADEKNHFVTKLEIKNQNNDNFEKRSQSMRTLASDKLESESNDHLSDETMMGSLEQLLAAIGLHKHHQTKHPSNADDEIIMTEDQSRRGESPISLESKGGELSYLEILNSKGINNLDKFSSLHENSELHRIGIVNDEHQRRLLMAAKIIRQALSAARSNFVENYRNDIKNTTANETKTRTKRKAFEDGKGLTNHDESKQSNRMPAKVNELNSGHDCGLEDIYDRNTRIGTETMGVKGKLENNECGSEPIYVNLQCSVLDEPPVGESALGHTKSSGSACKSSVSNTILNCPDTRESDQQFSAPLNDLAIDNGNSEQVDRMYNKSEGRIITNLKHEIRLKLASDREDVGQVGETRPVQQSRTIRASNTVMSDVKDEVSLNNRNSINLASQYQIQKTPEWNRSSNLIDVNVNTTNIQKHKVATKSYKPLVITSQIADDKKGSLTAQGTAPFTRGCSMRVSSRKPKKINSKLTSINPRDPKRHSHGWHTVSTESPYQSVSPAQRRFHLLDQQAIVKRDGEGEYNPQEETGKQFNRLTNNDKNYMNINEHKHKISLYQDNQSAKFTHQQSKNQESNHNSYHLLNTDSQIINSKSAYDLRVNFSKFLEI
jgi:hypothetical protein